MGAKRRLGGRRRGLGKSESMDRGGYGDHCEGKRGGSEVPSVMLRLLTPTTTEQHRQEGGTNPWEPKSSPRARGGSWSERSQSVPAPLEVS